MLNDGRTAHPAQAWLTGRGARVLGCTGDPFSGWDVETVVVLNPAALL
jgi:hypothetical protein